MTESKASPNVQTIKRAHYLEFEDYIRLIHGKDEVDFIASYDYMVDGEVHTIPRGFRCNLATIHTLIVSWLFLHGFHYTVRRAGGIHDHLYSIGYNRKRADQFYRECCREDGANAIQCFMMYYALRLFGWVAYNKAQEVRNG